MKHIRLTILLLLITLGVSSQTLQQGRTYFLQGDYEKALPYLKKVIKHEKRNAQKAREWFLLGQIENMLGHREEAYRAFKKVVGCHPPYEMEFNARIAQTEVMAASDGRKMISKLKRMAKSDNNQE